MKKDIINAMTVDVEDFFHVSAFESVIDPKDWHTFAPRVDRNTKHLLDLFEQNSATATFFVLGWVADKYPELIKEIADRGHEVASHGFSHRRATSQTPMEFREDVSRSKNLLEDIIGKEVVGYRAPSFSIGYDNEWAFDELSGLGFKYSSSTYPVKHDLYGVPDWPRFCHQRKEGIIEIPISTISKNTGNTGIGGGGFFRLYPYWLSKQRINKYLKEESQPYNFYFHPWEIDPEQPKVSGAGFKSKFRHYVNLSKMEDKLIRLLNDYNWKSFSDVYL
ncbi:XrtA system polysaccharide deacetylase [Paraglaciecola sp.]|uniref:XrtA system polysaccharide deacetylase n=1 Tax=Paraglaciecola sp. TaxID=1920173 RepID=UPI003EF8E115